MEKINFKVLFVIILILGAILGWQNLGGKILSSRFRREDYFQKLGLKKEQVRIINLSLQGKSLELKKEGDIWRIKGKKARETEVNEFLAVLFPQNPPEIVAKTSSRHSQMGVDEKGAIKIKINGEKEIWLGKSDGGGNFLRFPGSDEVWLVAGSWFSPSFDFSNWVDKTIISLDSQKLKKIDWQSPPRARLYQKKENFWWEGEKKVEDKVVEPLVSELSPLNADEVLEDQRPAGYSSVPKATLEIEWEGGSEKLEFFAGKDKYLVKRNSDGQEFLISSSVAQKFLNL